MWICLRGNFTSCASNPIGTASEGVSIYTEKKTTKTIGRDWLLWAIYLVTAAVTIITQTEQVLLFIGAGLLVWLVKAPPTLSGKRWGNGKTKVLHH